LPLLPPYGYQDLSALYAAVRQMVVTPGPQAVICKRSMCPGIAGVEGTSKGHDALATKPAAAYLRSRGHEKAAFS